MPAPTNPFPTLRAALVVVLTGTWLVFLVQPALPAEVLGLTPLDAGGWSALRADIGGLLLTLAVFLGLGFVGSARWLVPALVLLSAVLFNRLVGLALDGPSAVGLLGAAADLLGLGLIAGELLLFPWGLSRHPYHPAYARLEWAWLPLHSRPLMSAIARLVGGSRRPPALPADLVRTTFDVAAADAHPVPLEILRPVGATGPLPAVIWLHGGAFVLPEVPVHRDIYAGLIRGAGCAVVAVDHRSALHAPHPTALEDCLAAVRHVLLHAEELGLDPDRIALGGDSSGATLALATGLRLRDEGGPLPCFQLLLTPLVDDQADTPSKRRFTDTPVWRTALIQQAWDWVRPDPRAPVPADLAVGRAPSLAGLPPTWVETAELDPCRDEARALVDRLQAEGVTATWHEQPGTVHGYDGVPDAPPTVAARRARHAALSVALHRPRG